MDLATDETEPIEMRKKALFWARSDRDLDRRPDQSLRQDAELRRSRSS